MPTFEFTSPEGKSYSVEGPEGATSEQAFQMLQQHIGAGPQAGLGEDVAKSAAAGLGSATIGTLGMAGDVSSLLARGSKAAGDYIGGKMGFEPSPDVSSHTLLPTSQDIRSTVSDPIVPPEYEPKTALGGFAKTGAEFLPAMIGGPEGLGAKLLTRVAVPAGVSEAAGALTKDTAAEPWARAGGALAGGVVASMAAQKFKAMAAARNAENALPTGEQLLKTGGDQFNQARDMNVMITPDWAKNAASKMRNDLKGFDPEAQGVVFKAADRLENLGKAPSTTLTPAQKLQAEMNWEPAPTKPPAPSVAMNDAELIRKQLVSMKTDANASIREAARKAISSLQESQLALTPAQTLRGDAGAFTSMTKKAVENWAAGKRSGTVTGKIDLGNLNAVTAGSGANEDNALRQAFKQLARPVNNTNVPKWQRLGFNKEEGTAIEQAARGTTAGNVARYLGKAAPTGIVSAAMSGGAGHMAGGPIGAVALPVAGYIAKKIGDLSTKRAVAAVDSLVRSRSPLAREVAAQVSPQIIAQLPARTQRLLQATAPARSVIANQQGQPVGQTNP